VRYKGETILQVVSWVAAAALTMLFLAWTVSPQTSDAERAKAKLTQTITGTVGRAYELTIQLEEPSNLTQAFISLDASNRHAIVNSLQFPGHLESLYIDSSKKLAYVANRFSGLQILDISDPKQFRLLGSLPDIGRGWDITVRDGILFLASAEEGLYLIDIRSAETPKIISHLQFKNQSILKLAVSKQTVYATTGQKGLLIINISDLTTPRLVNTLYKSTGAWGLLAEKNRLYVSCGKHRLEILDISNPEKPLNIGGLPLPDRVRSMGLHEKVLYLPTQNSGLTLVDISDEHAPKRLKSSTNLDAPDGIVLQDNQAFISSRTGSISILDLTVPKSPKLNGTFTPPFHPRNIAVSDQTIYLACGFNGLQSLNANKLVSTDQVKSLPVKGDINQVLTDDTFFYFADKDGRLYVATRDAAGNPGKVIGTLKITGPLKKMVKIGNYLYIACPGSGLQIVDISNPMTPKLCGKPGFTEKTFDILTFGNRLLLADFNQGLQVVDITSPENPVLVETFPLQHLNKIAIDDRYVYAATSQSGLHILDHSTPYGLKQVGNISLPWPLREFAVINRLVVSGTTVYMAAGPAGLISFDTSNPRSPRLREIINLEGEIQSVTIDRNRVIATTRQGKLWILQQEPDGKTSRLNSVDTLGRGKDILVNADHMIIANGTAGLLILTFPQPIDISNRDGQSTLHIPPQATPGVYNLTVLNDGKLTEFIGAVSLTE